MIWLQCSGMVTNPYTLCTGSIRYVFLGDKLRDGYIDWHGIEVVVPADIFTGGCHLDEDAVTVVVRLI